MFSVYFVISIFLDNLSQQQENILNQAFSLDCLVASSLNIYIYTHTVSHLKSHYFANNSILTIKFYKNIYHY